MKFETKLALRFMLASRSQTIFIIAGIAIGVAVQIFLGSLITSLQDSLVKETIGNSSHITIRSEDDALTQNLNAQEDGVIVLRGNAAAPSKNLDNWSLIADKIEEDSRVTAVSPTLQGTALVRSGGINRSIQIKGVIFDAADSIYDVSSRIVEGTPSVEGNNILIGKVLAEDLDVAVGGSVNVLLPNGENVRLIVSGTFDLQNEISNSALVFMDLRRAQKLFNTGNAVSSIETQVQEPFAADEIADSWSGTLGGVKIEEWKELNAQLLSALSSQSSSSYTIQFFVIISITFGIASVLAVSVLQKSKEIGILKAMGATKKSASRIFIIQGFLLGIIGSIVGSGAGILLLTAFNTSEGLSFNITYKWISILILAAIATFAGVLASVIPARKSANLNPMEAIKNG
ncbi:MAG: ABC transporter permease [Clostridia bacterium]|nr:ABC transporter permease [Clostridia bacterium]